MTTIKARFGMLGRDMFWEIFDRETNNLITWVGYNDANWWENVAPSDAFRIRGRYKLDPETDNVTFDESENGNQ